MRKTTITLLLLAFTAGLAAQKPRLVVPVGHTDVIYSVAFSPDGKHVLTGSEDGTAKLWDLSGKELQTFAGHAGAVWSVAFSPNEKQVLTGSEDGTAKLWDLSGGEPQTFPDHDAAVRSVAFSPNGKQFLTGSANGTAKLWDLSGGEPQTFDGHDDVIISVAFSPDGDQVLTGSLDGTAKLWDLEYPELKPTTFDGHANGVFSVAFSPNSSKVLTGGADGTAKLWDLEYPKLKPTPFEGHADLVTSVAFSPNGTQILTGGADGYAKLWDSENPELQPTTFEGHVEGVTSVAFSPKGKLVLTGSWDKTAKLWDLSGKELQDFDGHAGIVSSVAFSQDGTQVLTGSGDGTAKLWDLLGRELQAFAGHVGFVSSVAFSPKGKHILVGSNDFGSETGTVRLWDLSGREFLDFDGHAAGVSSVAFSPNGDQVLTGSYDRTAKLWDLEGQVLKPTFDGHLGGVNSVAFSPDGKQVLTGSDDRKAMLWDMSGGKPQVFDHAEGVSSVAFSPNGEQVLTVSQGGTAKRWDLSGKEPQAFTGHVGFVSSAAFSRDGTQVLMGSEDRTAKLWDLSGNVLHDFDGHADVVTSVAFSPDGKQVLTGSWDKTTKLWDAHSCQELATLIALDSIDWAVTTPSGLFDASPGAMNLMHFVVGIEAIELEQLKDRYYEPGLLGKLTGFNQDSLRSVEGFDNLPLFPEMEAQLSEDGRKLQVNLRARSGGIGKLSFFVNGKEVLEEANPGGAASATIDLTKFAAYYLPGKTNKLVLRAYNAKGWLKSAPLELDYDPPASARGSSSGSIANPFAVEKPSLYAIVVGTADYAGDLLDLTFADLDAAYFSQALRAAAPKVFGEQRVEVVLLNTDAKSTDRQGISNKASIRKAFSDIAKKAHSQDVLVIYFSGHGLNYGTAENSQFYYLTKDIANENLRDEGLRKNYAISSSELTEWINAIPALKQVMIIDACNAGKIVEDLAVASRDLNSSQIRALDRMKDRTGMFILTGSAADKVSYEAGQYGQGLLTFSLLQGMSGLALTSDKRVDVMTLFQHARDEVPALALGIKGIQTPVLAFPTGGASFDIGIVDESVRKKIPVTEIKPVFIRNDFQDEDNLGDGLGLEQALADYFRHLTVKGAQAELIYVDVNEYENAYSINGLYSLAGDAVTVRARLFKSKKVVGETFTVTGKKADVPGLVEAIIKQVDEILKKIP